MLLFFMLYLLVIIELIDCLLTIWCRICILLFNVCVQFHTSIDVCMSIYVLIMVAITLNTVLYPMFLKTDDCE